MELLGGFLRKGKLCVVEIPNLRKMFLPDPGMVLFEADLQGADARVVAWEAGDEALKTAFRSGVDIHTMNADLIWPSEERPHPRRQKAKIGTHATNYGCKARTLADHLGLSERDAQLFITKWFMHHPDILAWHGRVAAELRRYQRVKNIWGYRRQYFDRVDNLLSKALAWIGQSTTAIAINKIIVALQRGVPNIEILLQVHDSVLFQIPLADEIISRPLIEMACQLTLPYDDPMPMPVELKRSETNWGEMKTCPGTSRIG